MAKRRGNQEGAIYQKKNGRWQAQVAIEGAVQQKFLFKKRMSDFNSRNIEPERSRIVFR